MRILQVASGLQKASGVTTFVENTVAELREMGHVVDVVTKVTGRQAHRDAKSYDIVHIHGLWDPWLISFAIRARVLVWSTHGMTAPWSLNHKWWKKCLFWWFVQKPLLRRARLIHSTVGREREWNEALGFRRHVVIPLGADNQRSCVNCSTCDHLGGKTLLFVGRIYPVKALDRLILAFQSVEHTGWRLRIVGPDQAEHMAALKLIASKDVEFVGPRFDEGLYKEYENCDCLALVSHTENFGAVVVDAMAHGKPVIVGTKTPWREVVERGCGWWVDNDVESLSKAIYEMMAKSDAERLAMGMRGRRLVDEKYSWHAVASALEVAYSEVCHK